MIVAVRSGERIFREETGAEDVDADSLGGELAGDVLRVVDDGRLRGRIGENLRERLVGRHAADIEDRPAARVGHRLADQLTAEMRALEVRVEDTIPVVIGDLKIRHRRIDAGAVDEDLDPAAGCERRREEPRDALPVGGVDREKHSLAPGRSDPFDARLPPLLTTAGDNGEGASCGEPFGERSTEDPGAADDDGRPAGEAEESFEVCAPRTRRLATHRAACEWVTGRRSWIHSVWKVPGLSVRA